MSKVKIQGNASGTGVLTITAPNTSTDRTIVLPDTSGTLLDENSSVPAANLTGTVADARISALTASKLTGALPAISGASLTGISAGKVLQIASTRTLQKTGTWTDTNTHTIFSLSFTPISASSTLYITSILTFQYYGNANGKNAEMSIMTKEGGTDIIDGSNLHWNTEPANNEAHATPSYTQQTSRSASNTNARTYTVTLANQVANRRLQTKDAYGGNYLQVMEVSA